LTGTQDGPTVTSDTVSFSNGKEEIMRSKVWAVVGTLVLGGVVLATPRAYAKCDATGADAGDIATARAAVAANCDCAGATNHGQYVKCATEQAKMTLVNQSCHGAVVKCAAKSTCGKPGFVTCCRTTSKGTTKCSTKSGADRCKPPKGGAACASTFASCCDACSATGCNASPSGAFLDDAR
jgi:hypothetical protein